MKNIDFDGLDNQQLFELLAMLNGMDDELSVRESEEDSNE